MNETETVATAYYYLFTRDIEHSSKFDEKLAQKFHNDANLETNRYA